MKFTKIATTVLALSAIALLAPVAQATNVGTYSDQDVLIGFNSSAAPNALLLDVGQISSLLAMAAAQSGTVSLGNINADLTSNFGPSYFGSTVQWGAAASDTSTDEVWATAPFGAPAWHSSFAQGAAYNGISATGGTYTNSMVFGVDPRITAQARSTPNTWGWSQPGGGVSISFNYFNPTIEGGTNQGLNFYYLPEGSTNVGTRLGTFNLSSNGALTFSTTAVPEPSTYGLMIGGLGLLGALAVRRRLLRQQG